MTSCAIANSPSGEPSRSYASHAASAWLIACGSARPISSTAARVERRAALHEFRQFLRPQLSVARQAIDLLDEVQQKAAIAIGHRAQRRAAIGRQGERTVELLFGAFEEGFERRVVKPAQYKDLGARQQRADQLKRRVLGRRADEDDGAVLDHGEKGILLRAIEAVDLVDKKERALPQLAALASAGEHLPQ